MNNFAEHFEKGLKNQKKPHNLQNKNCPISGTRGRGDGGPAPGLLWALVLGSQRGLVPREERRAEPRSSRDTPLRSQALPPHLPTPRRKGTNERKPRKHVSLASENKGFSSSTIT